MCQAALNRWVLGHGLKVCKDVNVAMSSGSSVQRRGTEQLKALSPTVVRWAGGVGRRVSEEERVCNARSSVR